MKKFEFQQEAIDLILRDVARKSNCGCAIMPTGTGKTWVSANVANNFKRVLYTTPNNYILNQARSTMNRILDPSIDVTYITYPYLCSKKCDVPKLRDFDLIIQDEYHRLGAPVWGKKMKEIVSQNPNAYVLGMTATDFRWLDSCRNMSKELYNNNINYKMTYSEAIEKGIYPGPLYVAGYTEVDTLIKELLDKLHRTKEENEELNQLMHTVTNLADSFGIGTIFKNYMPKDIKKLIVFNKTTKQFDAIAKSLKNWLAEAGFNNVRIYRADSKLERKEIESNIREFSRTDDNFNGIKIIISVNMLNEGIHVKGADGCIMLRHTLSQNIFLQQVGRPNRVGMKTRPVIFDLTDNLDEYRISDITKAIGIKYTPGLSLEENLGKAKIEFVGYLKPIKELKDKVDYIFSMIRDRFNELKLFIEKNGRLPSQYIEEEKSLYYWMKNHRSDPRVAELTAPYEKFELRFNELKKFIETYHRLPNHHHKEEKSLYNWMYNHRSDPRVAELIAPYKRKG